MPHRELPAADQELAAMLAAITGPDDSFGHRQDLHLAFLALT